MIGTLTPMCMDTLPSTTSGVRPRCGYSPGISISHSDVFDGEHLRGVVVLDHVIDTKPVDCPAFQMSRVIGTGHPGDQAAPFGDRQMNGLVPGDGGDGGGDLLRWRRDFE